MKARARSSRRPPREEMDRRWLGRAVVALLVVAFFVLIGRAAVLAVKSDAGRLSRLDSIVAPASSGAAPAKP